MFYNSENKDWLYILTRRQNYKKLQAPIGEYGDKFWILKLH